MISPLEAGDVRVQSLESWACRRASFFHVSMRVLGPCLVILAYSLQAFVTYAYFWHGFPFIAEDVGYPVALAMSSWGVFMLFNALYNYTKAILTPGGTPPDFEKVGVDHDAREDDLDTICEAAK